MRYVQQHAKHAKQIAVHKLWTLIILNSRTFCQTSWNKTFIGPKLLTMRQLAIPLLLLVKKKNSIAYLMSLDADRICHLLYASRTKVYVRNVFILHSIDVANSFILIFANSFLFTLYSWRVYVSLHVFRALFIFVASAFHFLFFYV